jgi:hypothetical protein
MTLLMHVFLTRQALPIFLGLTEVQMMSSETPLRRAQATTPRQVLSEHTMVVLSSTGCRLAHERACAIQ